MLSQQVHSIVDADARPLAWRRRSEPDPAARLVHALTASSAIIIVNADVPVAGRWLTPERVHSGIARALMGPTQIEAWPVQPGAVAVALVFPTDAAGPMRSLEVHAIARTFAAALDSEWTEETGLLPAFSVTPVMPLSYLENLQDNIAELGALLEILVNKQLTPQFQPIVSLVDGKVFGYETLIRGPKGAPVRRPGQMFRAADKARIVAWFDLACLDECMRTAAEQDIRSLLFINMDAEGLSAMAMQDRPLAALAQDHGLDPERIVIEVTERQTVGDFPRLIEDIMSLREQGFRIAIDDAGAGYSSLRAIAELRPEFVKIDRDLVKSLDVAGERRALLKALAQYAHSTGALVVAEGAETLEEVTALIDLGIPYCQGYVLGKPCDTMRGTPKPIRDMITRRVEIRERSALGGEVTAGMLARPGLLVPGGTPLAEAARRFARLPGLASIAVGDEGRAAGLLQRKDVERVLAGDAPEGADAERPSGRPRGHTAPGVSEARCEARTAAGAEEAWRWMRADILRVSTAAPVRDVMNQILSRQELPLDADIVVEGAAGGYEGVVSVRRIMEAAAAQPARLALYHDPLTGLPGRVILESAVRERIAAQSPLAAIRLDITRLESVNRRLGLVRGDDVIRGAAELIKSTLAAGTAGDMAAHLGGDDFVILTTPDRAETICRTVLRGFGPIAAAVNAPAGRRSNAEEGDRHFCALSIAAVTTAARQFNSLEQVMRALQDAMRQVRSRPGSTAMVDAAPVA